ncbi:MAG: MerR family transcriptional regulator [Alphaproteobacteria bacterium]|nr:MerR family transcriptional regulator [Alphaproteobacteria bacterium]MBN2675514.1 MerR family transcriptional regulator [Alphaproteobacteria bacterium]
MNNEYFLSINDVAKRLDLPAHTLRYWEKQFPAAVKPTTGAGGRRYYRTETVAALETIKDLLYNRGMTIAGVKKLLKDGTFPESSDFITGVDKKENVKNVVQKKSIKSDNGLFSDKSEINQAIDLLERARTTLS